MTKIFITGASGFVGSSLMKAANLKKINAIGVSRKKTLGVISYEDLYAKEGLNGDILVHCAAIAHRKHISIEDLCFANVSLSEQLAKFAKKNKLQKFIFISSLGVLGDTEFSIKDIVIPNPHDNYTRTKLEAESRLKVILEGSSTELVIVRPPLLLGKNAPGKVKLIEKLLYSFPVTPFGSLEKKMYVLRIEALCKLILDYKNLTEKLYMPVEDQAYSIHEIFDLVAEYHGRRFWHIKVSPIVLNLIFKILKAKQMKKLI